MPEMEDVFFTVVREGSGRFTEKMSRFLSFALPVRDASEARAAVKRYQNDYHDARHVCWAYMLGSARAEYQINDNGEPSGTAGKPILGQINSLGLTDVLVVVVRYFGGIKLGTPGLTAAYREAARLALEDAGRKEMHEMRALRVTFPYVAADGVMRIVKNGGVEVSERVFDNTCGLTLSVRASEYEELAGRLSAVDGAVVEPFSQEPL